jgi:hypothetical protein
MSLIAFQVGYGYAGPRPHIVQEEERVARQKVSAAWRRDLQIEETKRQEAKAALKKKREAEREAIARSQAQAGRRHRKNSTTRNILEYLKTKVLRRQHKKRGPKEWESTKSNRSASISDGKGLKVEQSQGRKNSRSRPVALLQPPA